MNEVASLQCSAFHKYTFTVVPLISVTDSAGAMAEMGGLAVAPLTGAALKTQCLPMDTWYSGERKGSTVGHD